MSRAVLVILGLGAGTYVFKAAGPVLLGGRRSPPALDRLTQRLPAALVAALVVVSTVGDGRAVTADARLVGLAAALAALRLRAPMVVAILASIAATALARLVAG